MILSCNIYEQNGIEWEFKALNDHRIISGLKLIDD
jgi:hypothetical protein